MRLIALAATPLDEKLGDLFVGGNAVRDVAGVTLHEELHRQCQHVPEKRLTIATVSLVCSLNSRNC